MRISVFGAGYVGLTQAAVLANVGNDVVCVDVDTAKVAALSDGVVSIYEPGLEGLVKSNVAEGRLSFTSDVAAAIQHADIQFIAVGTPSDAGGLADLRYVREVASNIARYMDGDKVVINKSTVPVGTADEIRTLMTAILLERGRDDITVDVVANPEFLKQGAAVADCQRPDRIIVGADSSKGIQVLQELYAPFNRNREKMILMDVRSAELTKYAANAFLATKISFMNEMANLAELFHADIEMVRKGIGADPRIGYDFIYPGCGYGGACFSKDVKALKADAKRFGYEAQVLRAVESVNNAQKEKLLENIRRHYDDSLHGKVFAVWGLAFKANTGDMREAPSRVLLEGLWSQGARVRAYDPEAMDECRRIYGPRSDLALVASKEAALAGAHALVVITDWQSFKAPDFTFIKRELKDHVIFDGRNLYDTQVMHRYGIHYYSIGRRPV